MGKPTDITLAISLGSGADFAITRDDHLVAVQEYAPGLHVRVQLGKLTIERIEQLQSYLDRLRCHAIER